MSKPSGICNVNCCVFGCHQKKGKNRSLSFHNFPSKDQSFVFIENKFGGTDKIDKYKAWMLRLKMEKPASKRATVCSLHFAKNDFILPDFPSQKRRLKRTAVPSLNLPVSYQSSTSKRRKERSVKGKESVEHLNILSNQSPKLDPFATEVINLDIEEYTNKYPTIGASTSYSDSSQEVLNCSPKEMNSDTDPLLLTPADNMSLFGDTINNIEFFVVEDDDEDSIESSSRVKQVIIPQQTNYQQTITKVLSTSIDNKMDLDYPTFNISIKDEEIKVEESQIQMENDNTKLELVDQPSNSPVVQDIYEGGLKKNTTCYVPNCIVDSENKDEILLFRVPRDENLKKIWDICIDRQDKRLSQEDVICHRHFSKEDILKKFIIRRKEGNITVPYSKPKLREGAVPCIQFHAECCVPTCKSTSGWMYCFPIAHNSDFRLWLYMIKNPILKKLNTKELLRHRVCEKHFETDCFIDEFTLKRSAAPTLNLPVTYGVHVGEVNRNSWEEIIKIAHQNMSLVCIYGECKSRSNIGQNIFQFPSDPDRCILWLKACGREELITTPTETVRTMKLGAYGVCEEHFYPNSFDRKSGEIKFNAVPKHYKASSIKIKDSKVFSDQEPNEISDFGQGSTISALETKPRLEKQIPFVCFYKGCKYKMSGDTKRFSFPAEKERYEAWLIACGYSNVTGAAEKELLAKSEKICGRHFTVDMFDSENNLKDDAVPKVYNRIVTVKGNSEQAEKKHDVSSSNTPVPQSSQPKVNRRLYCAVQKCANFTYMASGRTDMYYKFPDPKTDEQRFKMWLSLIGNTGICELYSDEEICQNYVVCYKHFETHFFSKDITKLSSLSEEAVPTKHLSVDIEWFFSSDYYKTRLQHYFNDLSTEDFTEYDTIEWRIDDEINNIDEVEDKTECVLQKDGIRFPGMGHYLYMGKTENKKTCKRKYPYGVYKHFKTGYGLNEKVEIGEHIRIHTAIIIDDDDECENAVLQQLLDKRGKRHRKKLSV